jgi:hypothetical protein
MCSIKYKILFSGQILSLVVSNSLKERVTKLLHLADNGYGIFKRTLGTIGSDDTLKYETVLKVDPISNINKHTFIRTS